MKRSELGSQRRHTNALIISLLIGATMCVVVPVQLFADDPATDAPQVPPSEGQTTMLPEQPAAPSTSDDAIETRGGMNPLALSPFSSDLSVHAYNTGYRDYYPPDLLGRPGGLKSEGVLVGLKVKNLGKDTAYDVRAVIIGLGMPGRSSLPSVYQGYQGDQRCRSFVTQGDGYPAMICTELSLAVNQEAQFYLKFARYTYEEILNSLNFKANVLDTLVQVMSATADPNLTNNWGAVSNRQQTLYPGVAATNANLATDLAVTMSGSADSANQLQTYQITVWNRGKSRIQEVAFTHAFSQALPGTSIVKLAGNGSARCASRDAVSGLPIVSCMVTELKAGATASATIIYRNPGNVGRTSTAQTIGANADMDLANNAVTISVPASARPPLEQQKVAPQSSTTPSVTAPSPTSPPLTMTPLAPSAALGILKPAPLQIQPKTAVPPTPTMPPPTTGKYRVVINGLRANHETRDDMLQFDGKRDEVYVAAFVRLQSGPYTDPITGRKTFELHDHGFVKSMVHGDVNNIANRTQAGTASDLGGIRTGDIVPGTRDPALPMNRAPSTTTFPVHVWEGTLEDGKILIIHPTLWEWDGANGNYNHWNVWMYDNYIAQRKNEATLDRYLNVEIPLRVGADYPMVIDNVSGHDHPIGMAYNYTNDRSKFKVADPFIVLTRARLDALFSSPSVIGGVPPVVIPIEFVDYGDGLEGNYTMYLRVEKLQ